MKNKWYKDIRHLFEGKDGRLSIRRVLGTIAFFTFIYIILFSVIRCKNIQEAILWSLVALIGGFFTMTTLQNISDKINKSDTENGE